MGIRDTEASDLMKLPESKVMLIVLLVNYRWEKKRRTVGGEAFELFGWCYFRPFISSK